MKKFQRILSALLAAGCALSVSACGQENTPSSSEPSAPASSASQPESSQAEPAGITYPIPGNLKFTYAIAEESAVTTNVKSLADTPFIKALEEATGVTLEIQHPAGADGFNLLFASGELPDIISYNFLKKYSGGAPKAIRDGIIYPINDLIEENAPDLKAVLDSNELYYKSTVTAEGNIIGFPFIRSDKSLQVSVGMIMRQDWLEDLNLDVPKTPDQLYDVLKAFQEKEGATYPICLRVSSALSCGELTSPFGLPTTTFYKKDGTVHYGAAEESYKEVLVYLHKLFAEGLLDPNFATIDGTTISANFMNGVSGLTRGSLGSGIGNFLQTMSEQDPNFDVIGIQSLVANDDDVPMYSYYDNPVLGTMTVITPGCKNKEVAAQFLNYNYTEEGKMLFNFGIEGESYTIVDGKPTYTELITNNPNGWTMQQALAQYTRAWSADAFVQDKRFGEQYFARPQQQDALSKWLDTDVADYFMPPVTIAEADLTEYSKLYGDISTYVDEMQVKFITGVEPLDNFDTYLATLEQMGVKRVIELQQAALDEFNAR